jgi:ketosteroid isomerase-like protein
MKKSLLRFTMIIPLVTLFCFTFSCQEGEEVAEEAAVAPLSDEDVVAIKARFDEYDQFLLSGDWDAFVSLFIENAVVMPPNEPILQGREAIKTNQEAFPPNTEFMTQVVEVDGRGDIAYVRGSYSLKIEMEGVPEPIQDSGKYISILRKQEDGSWLFAVDIWNSDMPLPPSEKE